MQRFAICLTSLALTIAMAGRVHAAGKPGGNSNGNQHRTTNNQNFQGVKTFKPATNTPVVINNNNNAVLNKKISTTPIGLPSNATVVNKKLPTTPILQGQNNIVSKKVLTPKTNAFVTKFAKPCSQGYCFVGKHHCHWTSQCWSPYYGCNIFWCPHTCCYYYWYPQGGCYYPVNSSPFWVLGY